MGKITNNPKYRTNYNIFPIGYICERIYPSYVRKGKKTLYRCEILRGQNGPIYRITAADDK